MTPSGFLDLPYRLPFARYYQEFDAGFYVDFPKQLRLMGEWLQEHRCRTTLDIGAMTGGCIEYISRLGIRMDGVQFTEDVKRLAAARLRKAGVKSTLFVSPVHGPLRVPSTASYDGIVSLGWFNLPFERTFIRRYLDRIRALLAPGGVFLFDFFQFTDVKVAPTEAVTLGKDIVYVSHSELLGKVLRRYHLWILRKRRQMFAETSDLVDRRSADVRRLLAGAGLEVVKTKSLDLNYPREFWLARKIRSGRG
ncbi:MAG: class I SAM-dependent methyltransferase [Planctomycetota bacterium]|nr:MAG: class I SAM-dependent methyltransferase [Planctomycetota bacterium]